MEGPAQLASMHVVCANVAGRCGLRFRRTESNNDHVLVNCSGSRQHREVSSEVLIAEILAQVHASAFAKCFDHFSGSWIQGIKMIHYAREQDVLPAITPK